MMIDDGANTTHDRPFYVGYLPLPPAIRRFLLPWLIANGVLVLAVAAVLAGQQRSPGDGTWDTSHALTLTGVLEAEPYPMLRVPDPDAPDGVATYLLVQQSKAGAQPMVQGMDGQVVDVHGYVIERDGRRVLELDGAHPQPVSPREAQASFDRAYLPEPQDLGTHVLVGEIVDPKCYLGAMKPGDGKPHKVCATLCIRGGIPPVFVVRDTAGRTAAYLLLTADGSALPASHFSYIADPIRLTGRIERRGDLLVLFADLDRFERLD